MKFHSADSNNQCGGRIKGDVIDFIFYGTRYSNNLNCTWVIHRNYSFVVNFYRFKLEYSIGCRMDYVQVGGGPKLCGSVIPDKVTVDGLLGSTNIKLYSDGSEIVTRLKVEIIRISNDIGMLSLEQFIQIRIFPKIQKL